MNINLLFGYDLSIKTYHYLKKFKMIAYRHKEYCGTGFFYDDQAIFYTHFSRWRS